MSARRWVALAAAGALLLRLALLVARGDYIVYDEGYYLLLARSLAAGHGFRLNGLPHVALSPLQPLIVAGLSLVGVPDVWASRLLAAACGAALVFPVAWLARRWGGEDAAAPAAVLAAAAPALLTFAPFGPHEWNLYFGSEPLFLLLGLLALVCAVRAVDEGAWRWWVLFGALGALAYLTRLEGAVLGVALGVAAAALLAVRGQRARLRRLVPAALVGLLVAAPYFAYLHSALGRWAVSGRVQAAGAPVAAAPPPATPGAAAPAGQGDALQQFVWGGDVAALWRTLYALDPSGTRMASQYWGVAPRPTHAPAATAPPAAAAGAPPAVAAPDAPDSLTAVPAAPSMAVQLARALLTVVPWWLGALALVGLVMVRPRSDAFAWIGAVAVAVAVPAVFAYVEPRALLLLTPVACVCGGVAVAWGAARLPARARLPLAALGAAVLLVHPVRDLVRAWPQSTPLQRAATARRVVGEYLAEHLGAGATIVSWHPALAVWAHRAWRVQPYDDLPRILSYARAQGAAAVVLSTFEPSPLRNPPRAFTVVLVDSAAVAPGPNVRLDPVEETPLVFVGRVAKAGP